MSIESEVGKILDADISRHEVEKVVRAFDKASTDAKHVFALVIHEDGTVEHFSYIPRGVLLIELGIVEHECRDRIIEKRETVYDDLLDGDGEDENDG